METFSQECSAISKKERVNLFKRWKMVSNKLNKKIVICKLKILIKKGKNLKA